MLFGEVTVFNPQSCDRPLLQHSPRAAAYAVSPEKSLPQHRRVCRAEWDNGGGVTAPENTEISVGGVRCFLQN